MKKYLVITHHGSNICSADLFVSKRDAYSLYAHNLLKIVNNICTINNLDLENYENIFTVGNLTNIQAGLERFMEKYKNDNRFKRTTNGYYFYGILPYVIEILEVKER